MGFALRLSPWFSAFRAPAFLQLGPKRRFRRAERGNVAVEFAIIGPLLILILSGIITYGGYFLTAHTVQQMANDAARAAIAGLDDNERLQLAQQSVQQSMASQSFMRGDTPGVALAHNGDMMSVRITYDARDDVFWAFAALLPVPAPTIARSATIRVGGF